MWSCGSAWAVHFDDNRYGRAESAWAVHFDDHRYGRAEAPASGSGALSPSARIIRGRAREQNANDPPAWGGDPTHLERGARARSRAVARVRTALARHTTQRPWDGRHRRCATHTTACCEFVTDGEGGSLEEAQLDALITKLRQDRARATTAAIDALPPEARAAATATATATRERRAPVARAIARAIALSPLLEPLLRFGERLPFWVSRESVASR